MQIIDLYIYINVKHVGHMSSFSKGHISGAAKLPQSWDLLQQGHLIDCLLGAGLGFLLSSKNRVLQKAKLLLEKSPHSMK